MTAAPFFPPAEDDDQPEIVEVKGIHLPWNEPVSSFVSRRQKLKVQKTWLQRLGITASLTLFILSFLVLWHIISGTDKNELWIAFSTTGREEIGFALLLTVVSYCLLTCYDATALKQLRLKIRYRTTALASFTSYAISFTLGFPVFTSGTIRYWIYSSKGLRPGQVATLTLISGFTFWLGMGTVLSWCLLTRAEDFSQLVYYISPPIGRAIGVCTAAAFISYLGWVSIRRRAIRIQGWKLELPGFKLTLMQTFIGALDTCTAAGILYSLLPEVPGIGPINFGAFLAIYVFATFLGMASNIPGGLGVFETTLLLGLSVYPREPVLGALLLFRFIYYLVPFITALALLGAYEIQKHMARISKDMLENGQEDEEQKQ